LNSLVASGTLGTDQNIINQATLELGADLPLATAVLEKFHVVEGRQAVENDPLYYLDATR